MWLPWILKPVARSYGWTYQDYHRLGYARFSLHHLQHKTPSETVSVDEAQSFVPTTWLWHKYVRGTRSNYLTLDRWSVQFAKTTNTPAESQPSPAAAWRELRHWIADAQSWAPFVELRSGHISHPQLDLELPRLQWTSNRLDVTAFTPQLSQTFHAQIILTNQVPDAIRIRTTADGPHAEIQLRPLTNGFAVRADILWQTNRLQARASLTGDNWVPTSAQIDADDFKIPAPWLKLPNYDLISTSAHAHWNGRDFQVALQSAARPLPKSSYPPCHADLRAAGDLKQVTIQTLQLTSPFLTAKINQSVTVSYQYFQLLQPAVLNIQADLGKQTWIDLTGQLAATLEFQSSRGDYPDAVVHLNGSHLAGFGLPTESLSLQGRLSWPLFNLDQLQVNLSTNSALRAEGAVNLATRTVQDSIIQYHGLFIRQFAPANVNFETASFEAHAKGSLTNLIHQGTISARHLEFSRLQPLDVAITWKGANTQLDPFELRAAAPQSVSELALTASLNAESNSNLNLQLRQFVLRHHQTNLLALAAPARLSFQRQTAPAPTPSWKATTTQLHFSGAADVSLQAELAWPRQGVATLNARRLRSSILDGFLSTPPPDFSIDHLDAAAYWSNGPIHLKATTLASARLTNQLDFQLRSTLETDASELVIRDLQLANPDGPIIQGHGKLPLAFLPGNLNGPVLFSSENPIELTFLTEPNRTVWNQLSRLTHLRLLNPKAAIAITGTAHDPHGSITAHVEELIPSLASTNPAPKLQNIDLQLGLNLRQVQLQKLSFLAEGQPVSAMGVAPLADNFSGQPSKWLQWNLATGLVQVANAQIASFVRYAPERLSPQGKLDLHLALRPQLQFDGLLQISGAATRPLLPLGPVQNISAGLRFAGRTVHVDRLAASIGGEPLHLAGTIDLAPEALTSGLPWFDLQLKGANLPLARQSDLILRTDLDLKLRHSKTSHPPVVSGNVDLRDSLFLSDLKDLMPGKVASPKRRPPYFSIDIPPLAKWKLDLRVRGNQFMRIKTPLFIGLASADFKITGTLSEPLASGEAKIDEGLVEFPFANLEIKQGFVSLSSADPFNPQLLVTASSRLYGYDVKLDVTGSAVDPVVQFSSTPSLSQEEIVMLLATGQVPQNEIHFSNQQRAQRLGMFLGRSLLSKFSSNQGAADRLTVRSGQDVTTQGKETYYIEYKLNGTWSLFGEYDRFSALNAGVKWRLYSK